MFNNAGKKMNNDELVARQARRIAELEDKVIEYNNACHKIHDVICCIGGPLNDNKLGYTRIQQTDFKKILNLLPDPMQIS